MELVDKKLTGPGREISVHPAVTPFHVFPLFAFLLLFFDFFSENFLHAL